MGLLNDIITRPWDGAYDGIELIALMDANVLLPRLQKKVNELELAAYRLRAETQPNDKNVRFELGVRLFREGLVDDAIREFRAALAIHPGMVEAHNNLGIALGSKGNVNEAAAEFRRALALNPEFADARKNLEMALRMAGTSR